MKKMGLEPTTLPNAFGMDAPGEFQQKKIPTRWLGFVEKMGLEPTTLPNAFGML
ncbi:MAG: hypothetical protein U0Y10_18385 [Spirosomataceae bacterium]